MAQQQHLFEITTLKPAANEHRCKCPIVTSNFQFLFIKPLFYLFLYFSNILFTFSDHPSISTCFIRPYSWQDFEPETFRPLEQAYLTAKMLPCARVNSDRISPTRVSFMHTCELLSSLIHRYIFLTHRLNSTLFLSTRVLYRLADMHATEKRASYYLNCLHYATIKDISPRRFSKPYRYVCYTNNLL